MHPPLMAVVALLVLILGYYAGTSDASWCVCKSGVAEKAIQTTLDYSCGAGADCGPIHQGGSCYEPNNVLSHCSYAANSYYQRMQSSGATCDFKGTAELTNNDPSSGSCTYPASASAAGGSGSASGNGSGTGTGTGTSTTPTGTFSPPSIFGLGPSGAGAFNDGSDGGLPAMELAGKCTLYMTLMLSALLLLRL